MELCLKLLIFPYAKVRKKTTAYCNLDLYSQYLLVNPRNRGCTKLSESLGTMSHDSVLNFLVREEYTPSDLFERVQSLCVLSGGTLSVDDSIWDKPYSKPAHNELIGKHYSGKHHRSVQGICLVTLFYTDTLGVRLPVNYRIYQQEGEKTKNELFRAMLDEVLDWGLAPQLITGDAWYASKENLAWIRRKELDACFGIEKDRLVSIEKGNFEQVCKMEIAQEGNLVYLKNFDFVTVFRKEQAKKVRHYIYYHYYKRGEDKPLKASRKSFEDAHKQHWNIEEFHRAKKQLCNAENFLVRRKSAVKTHIFAVYWAFVNLEEMVKNKVIRNWYQFRNQIQSKFIKINLT